MRMRPVVEARVFHTLLVGAALPVLVVPAGWVAVLWARRRARLTGAWSWAHRLAALAVVDTLVAAMLVTMLTVAPNPVAEERPEPPPVLGVTIDQEVADGVVVTPQEGSPAAQAGLLAGDIVAAVDGEPIGRTADLQRVIREGPVGPRILRVRRDGAEHEVEVRLARGTSDGTLRPGAEGLFVPRHASTPRQCLQAETPALPHGVAALWLGVVLVFVAALMYVGRGHRPWFVLGAGALVFAAASSCGAGARLAACALVGGHAPGTLLLGLVAHGLALMAGGAWLARRVGGFGPLLPPSLPASQVYAQSLFYTVTWVPRAAIVAWGLVGLASLVAQTGTPIDVFVESELGFVGGLLLLLGGAVLGPIAEELLFRGALLPWLATFLSPWRAIVASGLLFGALHLHHGLSIVGPFVIGLILGWARARSNGLLVPILLHMTFNAMALTMLVLLG